MQYQHVHKGIFLERPNRFIAHVVIDGRTERVHVKNTGRCRELLVPGATVYLEESGNLARKTRYDLIAVEKGTRLINMDAQAPNQVFAEWAQSGSFLKGLTLLRPEMTWGRSRFDFYWELSTRRRGFVEIKGVTLEENGHARFPDAPTERGVKHLEELIACRAEGYEAAVCFVLQMDGMVDFSPNDITHPAFGATLRRAAAAGVEIMARQCVVTPDSLSIAGEVPVRL
ncbi:DNA/RNA nuclease SfsA [Flavonifractor hominis]|uniref:Sugar fermentation stimulation protein homolog n=1 Tax=Flavonifractor hominis TaxID=3133178 RepID=A0ABV1ER30_9FIRM